MGLKFCNEAVIALQMIWPKTEKEQEQEDLTPLQVSISVICLLYIKIFNVVLFKQP